MSAEDWRLPSALTPEASFLSADPVPPRESSLGVGTAGRHLRALDERRGPIALRTPSERDSGRGPQGSYTPGQDRGDVQCISVSALASAYRTAGEQLASKSSAGQMLLPSSGSPRSRAGCGAGEGSAKPRVVSRPRSHSDWAALQSVKRSPGQQPQNRRQMQPLKGPAQPPLSHSALPPRPAGHPLGEASRVDPAPPNPAQSRDPEAPTPTGSQASAPVPPARPCRNTPPRLIVPVVCRTKRQL